jgi:6-phosphofructokinase 1
VPLDPENMLADVDRIYSKLGRCLIAMSEGVVAPDGKLWNEKLSERLDRDMHGNIQLSGTGALGDFIANKIREELTPAGGKKVRSRADTYGYLQRSFPGFVSDSDAREARLVGQMAVQFSRQQGHSGSVAMRRVSEQPYAVETFLAPLDQVARVTKHLDPSYIEHVNSITDAFRAYAAPLVGPLPQVGMFEELG